MLLERIRRRRGPRRPSSTAAKMCEPGLDEQVAYMHGAWTSKDIPYFVTEFEERMSSVRPPPDPARDVCRKPPLRLRRSIVHVQYRSRSRVGRRAGGRMELFFKELVRRA